MYNPFKRSNSKLAKSMQRMANSAFTDIWDTMVAPEAPKKPSPRKGKSKTTAKSTKANKTRTKSLAAMPKKRNERIPSGKPTAPATSQARVGLVRGAMFKAGTYKCEYGERTYKLYIPAVAKSIVNPLPLIVMLHGCNQTADDFARGTGMNVLAEEFGFYLVYPNQARKSQSNRCWNWFKRSDQSRGAGEPAIIAGLTKMLIEDYQIDPARVYIAGLSAGASSALVTAGAYPDIFAAAGAHSGLAAGAAHDASSALLAMRYGMPGKHHTVPLPTINFHGDADKVVNPSNSKYVTERAAEPYPHLRRTEKSAYAAGGRKYIRTSHRLGKGRSFVERWLVMGAGHAWSGGNKAGRYTDPSGPDASREMVRFFLRHRTTQKWRASFRDN